MPRFKGSCGCYNRDDARTIGLVPAIVWNDILDRSEQLDSNPMWYDQKEAANRLGIPERSMYRAVDKLAEIGRITKKKGYRPNSRVSTTWITIQEAQNGEPGTTLLAVPRKSDLAVPIYKDTNINKQNDIGMTKSEKNDDKKAEYGNPQVNALMEIWDAEVGITAKRDQANRRAAYNLIRHEGFEGARRVVGLIGQSVRKGDQFAPQVASFKELWGKYGKLEKILMYGKKMDAMAAAEQHSYPYKNEETLPDIEVSDEEREKVKQMMKEARKQLFGGVK